MKIGIILFGLLAWISCNDDKVFQKDAEIIESNAEWVNMLASDGCSWHFEVPSGDSLLYYVPDDQSLKKVEETLGNKESYYSFTKVRIRYSLTGRKKDVQCGWGITNAFNEIEIHTIEKK